MKYNPSIHHRRSIRLKGYDYSLEGMYFVTIRVLNGACVFGEVQKGEMTLSAVGEIAEDCWKEIPDNFENTSLDVFQVMPNHIHGIIEIVRGVTEEEPSTRMDLINQVHTKNEVRTRRTAGNGGSPRWPLMKNPRITLGKVVRSFKAEATKRIHDAGLAHFAWLGRFYEHVIMDGPDLDRIREYILENPANWERD